ncbi:unnamed protein product, partial [Discosporangium mesarthrocarpum]
MIEGESRFLSEETMMQAVEFGHKAVRDLCLGISAWVDAIGKPKKTDTLSSLPEGLQERVDEIFADQV